MSRATLVDEINLDARVDDFANTAKYHCGIYIDCRFTVCCHLVTDFSRDLQELGERLDLS